MKEINQRLNRTYGVCSIFYGDCLHCPIYDECTEVFGKECPVEVILELDAQCKQFLEFARANGVLYADTDGTIIYRERPS